MEKFPERHKSRGNPSGGRGGPSETRRPQRGPAVPAAARAEPQCPAAPPGAAVPPRRGRPPSLSPSHPPVEPAPRQATYRSSARREPSLGMLRAAAPPQLSSAPGGLPLPAGDAAGRPEEEPPPAVPGRADSVREQRPPLSARRRSAQTKRRAAEERRYSGLQSQLRTACCDWNLYLTLQQFLLALTILEARARLFQEEKDVLLLLHLDSSG